jgi:hypothetical protein
MDVSTARWRKGSRSDASNTCVEVAVAGPVAALRDSKNPTGPTLVLPAASLAALLRTV